MPVGLSGLISTTDGKNKLDNLSRIFRLKKKKEKNTSDKELFHIRKVEISGFAFRLKDYSSYKTPYRGFINWNDLDISDINLKANELQFKGGVMSGGLEELSFREKSGYICHEISGSAKVGNGKTIVKDFRLKDPWSDLNLPLFMMSYADVYAFNDYIAKVRMDAEFGTSVVDFQTIKYFSPELEDAKQSLVSGGADGVCTDLSEREGDMSKRLREVQNEIDPPCAAKLSDLTDGGNAPVYVGYVIADQHLRVFPQK